VSTPRTSRPYAGCGPQVGVLASGLKRERRLLVLQTDCVVREAGHTVVLVSFRRGSGGGGLRWPPVPCPEANSVVQVRSGHPSDRLSTTTERLPVVSLSQVMHVGRRLEVSSPAFKRARLQLMAALSEHFKARTTRPQDPASAPGGGERVIRDFSRDLKPGAAADEALGVPA
jgi:hypothetical protein